MADRVCRWRSVTTLRISPQVNNLGPMRPSLLARVYSLPRETVPTVRNSDQTGKEKGQLRLTFSFAWRQSMRKGPFLPKQFTPTQWSTQDDKAEFGKHAAALHRFRVQADVVHEEAVLAVVEYVWTHCPLQPGASGRSGSSKPPIRFVSSNIRFAGPAMAIQSLPSVTSSAHSGKRVRARDYPSRYRLIAGATLRARGGSARKAGSEYRRPPASSNDVEDRDRRPSHEMSSPIPVPTVPVQGTLF